jgi:hypothetical protein
MTGHHGFTKHARERLLGRYGVFSSDLEQEILATLAAKDCIVNGLRGVPVTCHIDTSAGPVRLICVATAPDQIEVITVLPSRASKKKRPKRHKEK